MAASKAQRHVTFGVFPSHRNTTNGYGPTATSLQYCTPTPPRPNTFISTTRQYKFTPSYPEPAPVINTMRDEVDGQINQSLAKELGLDRDQVEALRVEFKKMGRNPLGSTLEILALEHGVDEEKVKALFDLHLIQLRRSDGLPGDQKTVYSN